MAVYAIRAEGTDFYKIGWSKNPAERLRSFQTASPFRLHVVAMLTTCEQVAERKIHQALHARRRSGEWFELEEPPTEARLLEWSHHQPSPRLHSRVTPYDPDPSAPWEDPVGIADITKRLTVTRDAVKKWTTRYDDFPKHKGKASGMLLWDWPDVERWLNETNRGHLIKQEPPGP